MIDISPERLLQLSTAMVVLGFVAWATATMRRGANPASAPEAMTICRLLQGLIRNMQQHRGMSSAWLAGDTSFASRMQARRQDIGKLLAQLDDALRAEHQRHCPYPDRAAFDALRQHWQALVDGLPQRSAEDSVTRHSFLIATVLDWLSGYGDARLAPLLGDRSGTARVHSFTHRLPAVTEALGQARAIGSSVAARKGCSPVARVRLLFLIARAEALVEQSSRDAMGRRELDARDRARRSVAEMTRVVRADMLLTAGVTVSAEDYFALSTRTIDAVFSWIDACGEGLFEHPASHGRVDLALAQGL